MPDVFKTKKVYNNSNVAVKEKNYYSYCIIL